MIIIMSYLQPKMIYVLILWLKVRTYVGLSWSRWEVAWMWLCLIYDQLWFFLILWIKAHTHVGFGWFSHREFKRDNIKIIQVCCRIYMNMCWFVRKWAHTPSIKWRKFTGDHGLILMMRGCVISLVVRWMHPYVVVITTPHHILTKSQSLPLVRY